MAPAPPPSRPIAKSVQPPGRAQPPAPPGKGPPSKGAPAPPGRGAAPARGNPAAPIAPLPPVKDSNVARAGKFFEVRKGSGRSGGGDEDEDEGIEQIALPRSITQEQEEADLKRRLNREELVEIDKKHSAVTTFGVASEPNPLRRRGTGMWLLVLMILVLGALFAADHFHLLDKFLKTGQQEAPK